MSRTLLASALAVLVITGPTTAAMYELTTFDHVLPTQSASQDWCKDARSYNDDYETFCEVRDLKEAATQGLYAETGNGSLTVTGSSRRDVSIQARIMASAESSSDAQALAQQVRVTLEGGRLRATGPTTGRRQSWWVSYRAEVPSNYDLTLDASNGSVSVTGDRGTINAETANGVPLLLVS